MMLQYAKAERLWLKSNPLYSERWLQDRIVEDPGILGLGDLILIERERQQERAGRLDLLLGDPDGDRRYEVELMLGATDESHIIRCIEYWDIERRRYPAYEHCAVLVAEDITARFLNVIGLIAGSVPMIAVQLNALRLGEQIILDFVRVVDQRALRRDDEGEAVAQSVDRSYWTTRAGPASLEVVDELLGDVKQASRTPYQANYTRSYVSLYDGQARNFVLFRPRRGYVRLRAILDNPAEWVDRLTQAGLQPEAKDDRVVVNIAVPQFQSSRDVVRDRGMPGCCGSWSP